MFFLNQTNNTNSKATDVKVIPPGRSNSTGGVGRVAQCGAVGLS